MTLLEAIQQSSARLDKAGVSFGHGTSCAFDEAAWLVLWRLGLPLDDLDGVASRLLNPAEEQAIADVVQRRIDTRQPAAYLTGEAWLQGVPFTVDARCIIPRSLIAEVLADGTLDSWVPEPPTGADGQAGAFSQPRVLDLCTGNGSLAVLAAMAWPHAWIDAADISADALALAQINLQRHKLTQRIHLHEGDGLAAAKGRYALILCNPPYVNRESMQALPAEYRAEPVLALDGGPDGMAFIRPLLAGLQAHLAEDAALVLEIGHERESFEHAFPGLEVMWLSTQTTDDQVLLLSRASLDDWLASSRITTT